VLFPQEAADIVQVPQHELHVRDARFQMINVRPVRNRRQPEVLSRAEIHRRDRRGARLRKNGVRSLDGLI